MLTSEEQDRADVYALLAALLLSPGALLVEALAALPCSEGDGEFAAAWNGLLRAAACGPRAVQEEHAMLFVAPGTPRINPYQCYYLAGWLMDKPLARLRQDLQHLGLARAAGATELEDHLGALCETMRLLVLRHPPSAQQDFFARHLAGWCCDCLRDIAAVPGAPFYAALASFGQAFFALEARAFALDDAPLAAIAPQGRRWAPDAAGHRP